MAKDAGVSFRWGIPLLDDGFLTVPNWFFDVYTRAGVSRAEFLLVLHLARFHYEATNGQASPSVGRIAEQMDCSRRYVMDLMNGLEKRGFLHRTRRPGTTTVYDFSGLSKALLASWTVDDVVEDTEDKPNAGGELEFTCGAEFTGGVQPGSHEEEEERTRTHEDAKTKTPTGADKAWIAELEAEGARAPSERKQWSAQELREAASRATARFLEKAGETPWERWGEDHLRPRANVPLVELQRYGWTFETETGLHVDWSDAQEARWWVTTLAKLYRMTQGDIEVMRAAILRHRRRELALASPRSIINAVREELAGPRKTQGPKQTLVRAFDEQENDDE